MPPALCSRVAERLPTVTVNRCAGLIRLSPEQFGTPSVVVGVWVVYAPFACLLSRIVTPISTSSEAFKGRRGEIRWELSVAEDGERALQALFGEEQENAASLDLIQLDWNSLRASGSRGCNANCVNGGAVHITYRRQSPA
jgi:hypothetical protein